MVRSFRLLIFTAPLWLSPAVVLGGFNSWTTSGPHAANVSVVLADPSNGSTIFAGYPSGSTYPAALMSSTDGGAHWVATTLTGFGAGDMGAADPTRSGRIAIFSSFFTESLNGGSTWQGSRNGINSQINSIVFDPADVLRIYAGTGAGVFLTTDGATTWSLISLTGLTNSNVNVLAMSPASSSTFFAGTNGGGVFLSTDSGSSWQAVGPSLSALNVRNLLIDPAAPANLYAYATGSGVSYLYKSTDSGATWATAESGLASLNLTGLVFDPASSSRLYAATADSGVFKTTDGGASWAPASSGLPLPNVVSLTAGSGSPPALYVSVENVGVYRSTDGGSSWSAAADLGVPITPTPTVDPSNPARVYCDGDYGTTLFESVDGGGSWIPFAVNLSSNSIVVDPVTPQVLYTSGTVNTFKSTDSGSSWTNILTSQSVCHSALLIEPQDHNNIDVIGIGIWHSTDGGATWGGYGTPDQWNNAFAVDPANPSNLYVGSDLSCYRYQGVLSKSINGGASWFSTGLASGAIQAILIDPSNSTTVYASWIGNGAAGLSKSTDGGATWNAAGLDNLVLFDLAMDPSNPATLYAATAAGLYRSTDSAASWVPMPGGYPDVESVTVASDGRSLHIGTTNGVWDFNFDFLDVPIGNPFHDFVNRIATDGVSAGCADAYFCPTDPVLRSQMAVFLLRGEHGSTYTPPPCAGIFADVTCPSPFADWIEELYAESITGGCLTNPLSYCPNDPVSRAGMAVFLLVGEHGTGYTPPACTGIFADVACPSPFADWIEQLYTEGITGGCSANPLSYCPNNSVTRAQMAVFLTVTFALP